jgi:hypothetical protein
MICGLLKAEETKQGILKLVAEQASSRVILSQKDIEVMTELREILLPFANANTMSSQPLQHQQKEHLVQLV